MKSEYIAWLDSNDTEEYKRIVIVPNEATDSQRLSLLSQSQLTATRRRQLINNFAFQFQMSDDIPLAIEQIGLWHNLVKNRGW